MRLVRVRRVGPPEVLVPEVGNAPEPGEHEALVSLDAAGVNYIDTYHRSGLYARVLPFVPGSEGAGTVLSVGAGVSTVKVGDRVASVRLHGSYAESALARADDLVLLPKTMSTADAAALLLQGLTAHYLATSTYRLGEGQWCLVHAGAGGVGRLLCQIATLCGARVITTVSTEGKAQMASESGAEVVIRYDQTDFAPEVRRVTDGEGVAVVYDSVGRDTFAGSLDALAPRGMMVLFGQSSGSVPPVDPQILNRKGSLFLTRPTLGDYTATPEELRGRAADLFAWHGQGRLRVHVHERFPLDAAADAHRALESRRTTGKLLLVT
jgi:NADPH:quinone reductase